MAIINILPNGTTAGNIGAPSMHKRAKRKETKGWTTKVSSALKKWFYSIPIDTLDGHGYSFTFTVRDCPKTSEEWTAVRLALFRRMERAGCYRLQWLTEWQERGVPHLHGIAYYREEIKPVTITNQWLAVSSKYGSKSSGQDIKAVHNVKGWLNYLAKHAARGAVHYQRSPENVPEGWQKTGRMWGYRGEWVQSAPMRFTIDQEGYYQYRRIIKNINKAKMRDLFNRTDAGTYPLIYKFTKSHGLRVDDKKYHSLLNAMIYSRSALKCNEPNQSRMMGISDWISIDNTTKLLIWMGSQGYRVHQEFE